MRLIPQKWAKFIGSQPFLKCFLDYCELLSLTPLKYKLIDTHKQYTYCMVLTIQKNLNFQNFNSPKCYQSCSPRVLHFTLPIDLTIYSSSKNLCSKEEERASNVVCFCYYLLIKRVPRYLLFIVQPDDVPTRYSWVLLIRRTTVEPETHPWRPLPIIIFAGDGNSSLKSAT